MSSKDKKRELLKKLKALAERGVGGEKASAEEKLSLLMNKYGISDEDLSEEQVGLHEFHYKTTQERDLLYQIFYQINHERNVSQYRSGPKSRSVLIFEATEAEALQARYEAEIYIQLWNEEVEFLKRCFIQKHRLFWTGPNAPTSRIDRETAMRMQRVMNGLQDKNMYQAIEGGNYGH